MESKTTYLKDRYSCHHSANKTEPIAQSLFKKFVLIVTSFNLLLFTSVSPVAAKSNKSGNISAPDPEIKLVLQITVDQLRGDLPQRFKKRFGKGGFNYLFNHGVHYANAHYDHADTETAPGHATLSTGATPSNHGIVASEWWNRKTNRVVYSVEDESYPLLGKSKISTVGTSSHITGRAPTNLLSTTIGDEIYFASEKKAKIYGVSGKDRGAILPAGHAGKAFWLSEGKITSSSYYYKNLPSWVNTWNKKGMAETYRNKSWTLLNPKETYWRVKDDKRPYEGGYKHMNGVMPKKFAAKKDKHFYKGLMHSYVNDELVLDFAKHLIDTQKIGQGKSTDYLSLSFSSIDYVGHTWGVESLEAEDTILRVDKNLKELFEFINKKVGLKNTLIVLSADHGVAEIAQYMQAINFPSKVIDSHKLVDHINVSLKKKFDKSDKLISRFLYPYIYLNYKEMKEKDIDREDVEEAVVKAALTFPGIAYAFTASDIKEGELPGKGGIYQQVINNFNSKRSGDIHLIADQYKMLVHWGWNGKPGMHGTVWTYDTFVPIFVVSPKSTKKRIVRRVTPCDVAPTIAAYLGIKPPSASVGNPLIEAVPEK